MLCFELAFFGQLLFQALDLGGHVDQAFEGHVDFEVRRHVAGGLTRLHDVGPGVQLSDSRQHGDERAQGCGNRLPCASGQRTKTWSGVLGSTL